jgi:hypothetical protein
MSALPLHRREGWDRRLNAVLDTARARPYVLGEADCLKVACEVVEALTGTDFWPRFAGYTTKRGALVTIARVAPSLAEAVTATLGVRQSGVFAAWRGDLLLFRDESGEDHLGVSIGPQVALTAPQGWLLISLAHPGLLCSWRVG